MKLNLSVRPAADFYARLMMFRTLTSYLLLLRARVVHYSNNDIL